MGSLGTRKSKPSFLAFAAIASFVTIVTSQLNLRNLVMNLSTPSAAVGLYDIAASAGPLLSLSSFTSSSSSSSVPSQRKKYVVLSATIGVSARAEDYTYLAAVTARNWNNFGFTPIIVLVG
jgi:type IV secretory pathway protease TraF